MLDNISREIGSGLSKRSSCSRRDQSVASHIIVRDPERLCL